MRILWTLLKVVIALMVAIPLAIVALGLTVGIVGALLGLAIVALKLAFFALIAVGVFRLARRMFGSKPERQPPVVRELAEPTDRYYEAAMRELDVELGRTSRT
jgi:membrane protein implicated in regulation of membrane protease activity